MMELGEVTVNTKIENDHYLIMIIFFILLDVNECADERDSCDGNAYCLVYPNSISYSCQCKDGFEGDGFQCNKLGTCQLFLEILGLVRFA